MRFSILTRSYCDMADPVNKVVLRHGQSCDPLYIVLADLCLEEIKRKDAYGR